MRLPDGYGCVTYFGKRGRTRLRPIEYVAPTTVDEAVSALAERGEAARPLAGGTDIIVQLRGGRRVLDRIVDVKKIPELNELSYDPQAGLRIGAAVPCHRIYEDEAIAEAYPGIIDAASLIGGIQIQGRASIGGNLCNAAPSGDSIPALIAHNAVAELPGADLADEVIMLGGHLDSWHAATGATDNAVGVAVMMEAARILAALGVEPRRTIRVALWGGEEQGLLGSQAYVKAHFGTAEEPTPEHASFGGYFNIDAGTGRARGAQVFGPSPAGDVLREALAPFRDLGVMGARSTNSRRRGGSDHTSFNAVGLPGISMRQDPIQYGSHTWHTNLDTYERVLEQDAIASAITVAAAVYHLAMRDELLPRFAPDEMPPAPGERPGR